MIVVPSRDDSNGCVCATESAYHPRRRHETTITTEPHERRERNAVAEQAAACQRPGAAADDAGSAHVAGRRDDLSHSESPGPVHYWTQAFENIM